MAAPTAPDPGTRGRHRSGGRRRPSVPSGWTMPVLTGLAFGFYAWFLDRDEGFSVRATVVGIVAGAVAAVCVYLLTTYRLRLVRELRATAYGVLAGAGVGFLHSLAGGTWLASSFLGLIVGAAVFAMTFYRFYTHET
jgi:hypothetical protein